MSDHDAQGREIGKLKQFQVRLEKVIPFVEGLMAAGGKVPGVAGAALSDEERGRIIDGVVQQLGGRLSGIEGRVDGLEKAPAPGMPDMSSFDERLNKLETATPAAAGVGAIDPELADRTEAMLTWFETNKEGLELLLSLDGDPDAPEATEPVPGGVVDGAGSVSGEAGTTEPASPGAPAEAAAATDQPAAKPEA